MPMNEKQIQEFLENPVALDLLRIVKEEIDDINATPVLTALDPGNPSKTQEFLANLAGQMSAWAKVEALLEFGWTEDDEPIEVVLDEE